MCSKQIAAGVGISLLVSSLAIGQSSQGTASLHPARGLRTADRPGYRTSKAPTAYSPLQHVTGGALYAGYQFW